MKMYIAIPCVMSVSLLGLSCTDEAPETPQEPGAKPPQENAGAEVTVPPEPKPEVAPAKPAAAPAKDLGSVSAKANEKTPVLDFKIATAVVTNSYDKFSVSLSDVADDPVRDSGQFPPVDDEKFHHRILLRFGEEVRSGKLRRCVAADYQVVKHGGTFGTASYADIKFR